MASIKKRATASGDRYDVRWRNDAGRPVERTFRTRKEADAFRRTIEHDELVGLVVDRRRESETFGPYAERWLTTRLVKGRPLDDELRPYIDGHRVTVEQDQRFRKEWAAFYDASACPEGNCDGEAGHDGPHFCWVAE